MYPEPGTRTHAIWEYIKEYAMQNGGASPSVRDFIHDSVDNITSTSLVNYHLEKLENVGLITRRHSSMVESRSIEVVGGLYVLPINIQKNMEPFSKDDLDQILFPSSVESFIDWIVNWRDAHNSWASLSRILVATDDTSIQLVAIGCNMPVVNPAIFDEEEEEEDEEENTRVPV